MNSPVKKLLKEHEVAELLGVSVRTLQHWRLVGDGPTYTKIGRCVRYMPSSISEYVIEHSRTTSQNQLYGGKSYG